MSTERLDVLRLCESIVPEQSPAHQPMLFRLQQTLVAYSGAIGGEDFRQSETILSELVDFLHSISDAVISDPCNGESKNNAHEVLVEIYRHLCSPSLDQNILDGLSFELPKAVAKFAGVDCSCMKIVDSIIDRFIEYCSPRDMLSILCEALDSPNKTLEVRVPSYFTPILKGLSKESFGGDADTEDLFDRAIGIANSIQAICLKLEGKLNEKLRALLGLYVLQIMALLSFSIRDEVSIWLPLVSQLSHFFPYCSLSYLGFITGSDVDKLISIVLGEDEDDYMSCFSHVKHGAALAVVWGHIAGEVAEAAEENLALVKDELRCNQTKRWEAVGMLKHVLASFNLPWELKKHAINFLLGIVDGNISQIDNHTDCSSYMPSIFAGLEAVEMVIMYSPEAELRKNAFVALKRVLADIPSCPKFDILKALITNSDSSSMIAILVDCVKEELRSCQRILMGDNDHLLEENKAFQTRGFWSTDVLELVELVLRPPKGGPPSLPQQSDGVLSALNLYRFVLITESSGRTNYTGVLSKNNLHKAYNEWLLPLRTLVTGIVAENRQDFDQIASDPVCGLNPVEIVLYRCIELVEEKLKCST
ncbi:aberrant root formation protein 4 isoform X2 [Malania oleifera]|uniref:aberrant root formation protein 4 isoform X2 n=1 Tax=Malania oleifera TaxID=397392 RepID=UPI0025AE72B0|nr:aberrant root formation protein 4 isoform X2 [Malania oleifera]